MTGGKGLCRVFDAEPITATDIFVSSNFSIFMEDKHPPSLTKYYSANLNVTVGLARYLEMYFNIIPYQDDQIHTWGRIGDTQLGVKYLTPLATNVFKSNMVPNSGFKAR